MTSPTNINLTMGSGEDVTTLAFTPVNQKGDVVTFMNRAGGVAVGFPTISIAAEHVADSHPVARYKVKATIPVLEKVLGPSTSGFDPAPTKAYHLQFDGTFTVPKRSTEQQRQLLVNVATAICQNAGFGGQVVTLDAYL